MNGQSLLRNWERQAGETVVSTINTGLSDSEIASNADYYATSTRVYLLLLDISNVEFRAPQGRSIHKLGKKMELGSNNLEIKYILVLLDNGEVYACNSITEK